MIEQIQSILYTSLLSNCPVDTGNMVTNIYLSDYGEYYSIQINVFYAKYVNYNRQRTAKEQANFHWVEKIIKQVSEQVGANIVYEIY